MTERSPARRVVFAALALALPFLTLELALQVAASASKPDLHIPEGADVAAPDPEAVRIIGVGDSWMWGAESPPEAAFIEVAARSIAGTQGRPVQIYNLGAPGSNSAQALVRLAPLLDGVQPHLVVALTGSNDVLHDTGGTEAARIIGGDARMTAGPGLWDRLRTVRLVRLLLLNTKDDAATPDPWALPPLPTAPTGDALRVELPWWSHFVLRRWEDGALVVAATPPPKADLAGVSRAWEALFFAYAGQDERAEQGAAEALAVGGDDATAWEARAVLAERRDEGLFAFFHRVLAAGSEGHPWIRTRARGLVLVELEAWEPAQQALLAALDAVPGNLEALLGLARIPETARSPAAEAALYGGPRGFVQPEEYMLWHLRTSGDIERAIGSLSDPDPVERAALRLARARAYELLGRLDEATAAFSDILDDPQVDVVSRERAAAGLLRAWPLEEEPALRQRLATLAPTPRTAPALAARLARQNDCEHALEVAIRGLAGGLAPIVFEDALGQCLDPTLGWAIVNAALAAGPVLNLDALTAGLPAERLPGPIPAPTFVGWAQARRARVAPGSLDNPFAAALLLADGGQSHAARQRLRDAGPWADPATEALAEAFILEAEGRGALALASYSAAAAATGEAWSRAYGQAGRSILEGRFRDGQRILLAIHRVTPGLVTTDRLLRRIPEQARFESTRRILDRGPGGGLLPGERALALLDAGSEAAARALARDATRAPEASDALMLAVARALHGSTVDPESAAVVVDPADARCAEALARAVDPEGHCHPATVALRRLRSAAEASAVDAARAAFAAGVHPLDVLARREDLGAERIAALARQGGVPDAAIRSLVADAGPSETSSPLQARLDAMARLSRAAGAQFVALTYPFPSGHHQRVRDDVIAAGEAAGFDVLDAFGAFEGQLSPEQWRLMRTPQDHVNAEGYARIGALLAAWVDGRARLDPTWLGPRQPSARSRSRQGEVTGSSSH